MVHIKRFWKHGLFEDVSITADSIVGDKIYLGIALKQRPRVSQLNFHGIKKSEREDLELKIGIIKGNQITPDITDRAKRIIKNYFAEKGYKNAEVAVVQRPDVTSDGKVIVDVSVDKKEKIKINRIYIDGVNELPAKKVKYAMKKTREKTRFDNLLYTLFRSKKFTKENFDEDKDEDDELYERYMELMEQEDDEEDDIAAVAERITGERHSRVTTAAPLRIRDPKAQETPAVPVVPEPENTQEFSAPAGGQVPQKPVVKKPQQKKILPAKRLPRPHDF